MTEVMHYKKKKETEKAKMAVDETDEFVLCAIIGDDENLIQHIKKASLPNNIKF